MEFISLLPGSQATTDALDANRVAMDVIAQNIANAQTTKDIDGSPYQRREVVFEAVMQQMGRQDDYERGIRVAGISRDESEGAAVYNPGHPHADAQGMVMMPNVSTAMEMVDLITTSRAYEANLSVMKTAQQMAKQALSIGR